MAQSKKSMKWILYMSLAICVCLAVVLTGTFSLLQASKTASGVITFNLADYDVKCLNITNSASGTIAPKYSGTTDSVRLINSYKRNDGAWAGLSGVYVKITDLKVVIGDASSPEVTFALTPAQASGANDVTLVNNDKGVTVKLKSSATNNTYWNYATDAIYLVGTQGSTNKTTLGFSEPNDASATIYANIAFDIAIADPGTTNGFNATTSTTNIGSKYQGKTITISYTVKWATTESGLSA